MVVSQLGLTSLRLSSVPSSRRVEDRSVWKARSGEMNDNFDQLFFWSPKPKNGMTVLLSSNPFKVHITV